ncbi:MAG: N-acetyltransferase [Candidatus Zixiibacteriota bacterium]|nr:MAG: N-acetyltransferase [candidate division Zixibacteria bacterium]
MQYAFEQLTENDRKAVIDIFNYFVENSFAAYPEKPVSYETFNHFLVMIGDYPAVCIRSGSGETVGFGFLRPYYNAETFRRTAEITYFIRAEHTGKGLGTRLLNHFIEKARLRGIDIFLASISSRNEQSIAFHLKHGFVECGRFKEIGTKHGKPFDMVWMQKNF